MNPDHSKDGGPGTLDPKLGSNESFLFLYRYYEKTSEKSLVRCNICKLESRTSIVLHAWYLFSFRIGILSLHN